MRRRGTPTRIAAADARNNFAEIIGRAHFAGEAFVVEKQGKPYAVVIGIDEYRRLLDRSGGSSSAPESGTDKTEDGSPG